MPSIIDIKQSIRQIRYPYNQLLLLMRLYMFSMRMMAEGIFWPLQPSQAMRRPCGRRRHRLNDLGWDRELLLVGTSYQLASSATPSQWQHCTPLHRPVSWMRCDAIQYHAWDPPPGQGGSTCHRGAVRQSASVTRKEGGDQSRRVWQTGQGNESRCGMEREPSGPLGSLFEFVDVLQIELASWYYFSVIFVCSSWWAKQRFCSFAQAVDLLDC
jgi:hypothetical protein